MPDSSVSIKVEEALIYRMKQAAFKKCQNSAEAYAACCKTRSITIPWACKSQFKELNSCLAEHTQTDKLSELKARWLAAGQPEIPDWDALLEGL